MSGFLGGESDLANICVAGAGAIGLTIAARLRLGGFNVSLIARGDSVSFIKQLGIELVDREGSHRMSINVGPASEFSKADMLFLCPKSHDMLGMAAAVRHLISPETIVVPVINGIPWWYFDGSNGAWNGGKVRAVDPDGMLRELMSRQIVGVTTMITGERTQQGTARTYNRVQMTVGELDDRCSARLDTLVSILDRSGIAAKKAPRIRDAIWTKVVRNLISNPVTAITGATLRQNFGNALLADVSKQMIHEVLPVIAANGANLEVDADSILESGRMLGDVKTSMLQDLERRQQLELASICDAVIELAFMKGISMPVTQAINNLAHFKSDRDRNLFAA